MGSSFRLFAIRGIDVKLHITFPLILLWAAFQFGLTDGNLTGALFGVVAVSLLFVLVTLHELGHSFAAQYFGYPTKQIILSPLGGLAQLSDIPEKPIQEFIVAIAGPAVNIAIGIVMLVIGVSAGLPLTNYVFGGLAGFGLEALFGYVFFYNIVLALFNLMPAFPLDGGRIFRSLLAMKFDYVRATTIAVTVGRALAVLLGIYGLLNGGIENYWIFAAPFISVKTGQMLRGANIGFIDFAGNCYISFDGIHIQKEGKKNPGPRPNIIDLPPPDRPQPWKIIEMS